MNIGEPGTRLDLLEVRAKLIFIRTHTDTLTSTTFGGLQHDRKTNASRRLDALVDGSDHRLVENFIRNGTSSVKLASRPSPDHGMDGTFAVCAKMFAAILSPNTLITGAVGPMNCTPIALSEVGSFGFSDA